MEKVNTFIKKNSNHIATGVGIVTAIATIAEAIRATVNVTNKIRKYKEENKVDKIDFKTTVKLAWKDYILTFLGATMSTAFIIAGDRISENKKAALTAAWSLSENTIKEIKEKTKEVVGEETAKKIEHKISEDKINEMVMTTDHELVLGDKQIVVEPITNQRFYMSWNEIESIVNRLNADCIKNGFGSYIPFNDFLYALGLKLAPVGDDWGWDFNHLISISPTPINIDGIIYVGIEYDNRPIIRP